MAEEKNEIKNSPEDKKEVNEEKPKKKLSFSLQNILNNKNLPLYLLGLLSSLITFIFFYFSNSIIAPEKKLNKELDIYKIAKEEAVKMGRILQVSSKDLVKTINASDGASTNTAVGMNKENNFFILKLLNFLIIVSFHSFKAPIKY